MKLILTMAFLLNAFTVPAQDTWTIRYKGNILLKNISEDEEKNEVNLRRFEFGKNIFELTYNQRDKQKGWKRRLSVYTEDDLEIFSKEGTALKLSDEQLKQWSKKYGVLKIYSTYLPKDPKVAATIRVRRVHLCTIRFV